MLISQSREGGIVAHTSRTVGADVIRGSAAKGRQEQGRRRGHARDGAPHRRRRRHRHDPGRAARSAHARQARPGPAGQARRRAARGASTWSTSNRIVFAKSWDQFILPLPFGRGALIWGDPIAPPAMDASDAEIEAVRLEARDRDEPHRRRGRPHRRRRADRAGAAAAASAAPRRSRRRRELFARPCRLSRGSDAAGAVRRPVAQRARAPRQGRPRAPAASASAATGRRGPRDALDLASRRQRRRKRRGAGADRGAGCARRPHSPFSSAPARAPRPIWSRAARRRAPRTSTRRSTAPARCAASSIIGAPTLGVFVESELWPNLILAAEARRIPLALVNARMSPKSRGALAPLGQRPARACSRRSPSSPPPTRARRRR